jgi:hypothetical protein
VIAVKFARIPFVLLALSVGACAAKPVPPPVVDLQAMSCDAEFVLSNSMAAQFDPKDEKVTIAVLDGKARCLQEAAGSRALYQVFALPDLADPYVIAVRAMPWDDTILAPRTMLLDGNGHVTRAVEHQDFTFRGQTLSTLLRSHSGERYLVVVSDSQVLGNKVSRIVANVQQTMGATAYGTFYIYTGTDKTNNMTLTPSGRVELALSPIVADKKAQ